VVDEPQKNGTRGEPFLGWALVIGLPFIRYNVNLALYVRDEKKDNAAAQSYM
jgi:hypothetical protein